MKSVNETNTEINMHKRQRHFGVDKLIAVFSVLLITVINGQTHETQPYQYSMSGFRSDLIRFPDDTPTPAARFLDNGSGGGSGDGNYAGYQSPKRDTSRILQRSNEFQSAAIPLNITRRLNSISSFEELYDLLEHDENPGLISPRFGGDDVERSLSRRPKPASCIPTDTVIPLRLLDNKDPSIIIFPSCTRVKQCGGCCVDNLLSCQPTATQSITYEVKKLRYNGASEKLSNAGREPVIVEEHTACKCDCRIKQHHCNAVQRYDKAQCACYCINAEDRNKCLSHPDKIWDPSTCTCRCREISQCTTGTYFDVNYCKCNQMQPDAPVFRDTRLEERKRLFLRPTYLTESPDTQYDTGT